MELKITNFILFSAVKKVYEKKKKFKSEQLFCNPDF